MTDEEKEKYQKLMERRAREGKDPYGWREDWEKTLKEFHVNEKEE